VFFICCITPDYNKNETNTQTTPTSSNTNTSKRIENTIAYLLENGESLRTFISTQNDLNKYSKYENEPTDNIYKEKFTEYENITRQYFDDHIKNITEKEMKEKYLTRNIWSYPSLSTFK
jgi:hypothetical protein